MPESCVPALSITKWLPGLDLNRRTLCQLVLFKCFRVQTNSMSRSRLVTTSRHSGSNPIGRFLKKITVPVLVMHGDHDQIAPYADSAPLSAKLLRNSTLKTYKGFPHGMPTTEADTINADLLTFLKGASTTAAA